jgi:geranylgeranyl pyrophosphate synthase
MSQRASGDLLEAGERAWVEDGYRTLLKVGHAVEPGLRGALEATLSRGGGLARAQIAYDLARSFGGGREAARELAIGIEYLHTASLLLDDLPSMDDAVERRGGPCPHRLFGEGATVLAALALINRAYDLLWRSIAPVAESRRERASALVASCLGLDGVINGQALDLAFGSSRQGSGEVLAAAAGKTVAMTRLTLVLPACVHGAEEAVLDLLDDLSRSWGHAYQIVDDFRDGLEKAGGVGKTTGRDLTLGRPNLPRAAGAGEALARAEEEIARASLSLRRLEEAGTVPRALLRLFEALRSQAGEIAELLAHRVVA